MQLLWEAQLFYVALLGCDDVSHTCSNVKRRGCHLAMSASNAMRFDTIWVQGEMPGGHSHKGPSCQLQADRCAVRVLTDSLHALCYSSNALWRQSQRTLTLKYWCVVSLSSLTLCMLPAYK